jgi:hypothetical protein
MIEEGDRNMAKRKVTVNGISRTAEIVPGKWYAADAFSTDMIGPFDTKAQTDRECAEINTGGDYAVFQAKEIGQQFAQS